MNEKINLPELIGLLAEKSGITKKDAENFLREFFEQATNALISDQQIKIKNLGSFKLTDVNERESVDVRTGKRVIIPAHTKVSYTPDNQLSQLINEPFAIFDPMELNDEIKEENTEKNTDPKEPVSKESEIEEAIIEEMIPEDIKPHESAPQEVVAEEVVTEKVITEERYLPKISWQNKEPYRPQNKRKPFKTISIILGTIAGILLLGYGAYLGNKFLNESEPQLTAPAPKTAFDLAREDSLNKLNKNNSLTDSLAAKADTISKPAETVNTAATTETKPTEKVTPKEEVKPAVVNEVKTNKPEVKQEVKQEIKQAKVEEKPATPAPKPADTSAKKRTIVSGERLTTIALDEYGNKIFWIYIYQENKAVIKNPQNVPVGLQIVIPAASKYGIDKDNPESIKKAANAATTIK